VVSVNDVADLVDEKTTPIYFLPVFVLSSPLLEPFVIHISDNIMGVEFIITKGHRGWSKINCSELVVNI